MNYKLVMKEGGYKIILKQSARKFLERLPRQIAKDIDSAIISLAKDPLNRKNVRKLTGSLFYRLRVGDYRIIFERQDKERTIAILKIGHRKDVYR